VCGSFRYVCFFLELYSFRQSDIVDIGGMDFHEYVCVGTLGAVRILCCYLVFVTCSALNIGLCVCVCVCVCVCMCPCHSFLDYFANFVHVVFFQCVGCFPFLCVIMMSVWSLIVPYLFFVFNMWVEYLELLLLFLIACICICIWCGTLCSVFLCI
jgi:hypothetical protein